MDDNIAVHITNFILDRKARGLSRNTLQFYRLHLQNFCEYLQYTVGIHTICAITPVHIRNYISDLHRNEGGKHGAYRAIKAFLNWYWIEYEPDMPNPIDKVKFPPPPPQPIPGVTLDDIKKLLDVCDGVGGKRDKAVILLLMDSGLRASELTALNVNDVDLVMGIVRVRKGKGGYARTVFIGDKTRRAIRRYLKDRSYNNNNNNNNNNVPLISSINGDTRLDRFSLRAIINRRSRKAGISSPGLHDFRRFFALSMLRNGVDLLTISRLLGHHNLAVTQRYLAQTGEDLFESYRAGSPVDHADL